MLMPGYNNDVKLYVDYQQDHKTNENFMYYNTSPESVIRMLERTMSGKVGVRVTMHVNGVRYGIYHACSNVWSLNPEFK